MKAFILTEADLRGLLDRVDRYPLTETRAGSESELQIQRCVAKAHKFYNQQVREWLDGVKS